MALFVSSCLENCYDIGNTPLSLLPLGPQKGHFIKALVTEGESQRGGGVPYIAGWLTPFLTLYSPTSLCLQGTVKVSQSFRMLGSAVHNCALGLDH